MMNLSEPLRNEKVYQQANEIESLYELVAEGLYDLDVPESDDEDIDSNSPILEFYVTDKGMIEHERFQSFLVHYPRHHNITYTIPNNPHAPPPKCA